MKYFVFITGIQNLYSIALDKNDLVQPNLKCQKLLQEIAIYKSAAIFVIFSSSTFSA